MVAVLREPRQIDRQDAQEAASDDIDLALPCLTGFTAGELFPILDGLQACLREFEKCDVALVSRRTVCDTAPVDNQPMEKRKCPI